MICSQTRTDISCQPLYGIFKREKLFRARQQRSERPVEGRALRSSRRRRSSPCRGSRSPLLTPVPREHATRWRWEGRTDCPHCTDGVVARMTPAANPGGQPHLGGRPPPQILCRSTSTGALCWHKCRGDAGTRQREAGAARAASTGSLLHAGTCWGGTGKARNP